MNKYKRLSRPPLAIMVLLAVVSCLAVPDADCWASNGLVQMQIASRTKLDVSKGNIKIGASQISGLTPEGKQETQVNREGYHITGETGAYSITIEEGVTADILLDNVNISLVDEDACALKIAEASKGDVTVTLRGQNVLKSGSHCAGLEKSCNQTSCVRAKSQCTCGTLTIQCEKYNETGHICNEDCGSLIASGVNGGAGIGGGTAGRPTASRFWAAVFLPAEATAEPGLAAVISAAAATSRLPEGKLPLCPAKATYLWAVWTAAKTIR